MDETRIDNLETQFAELRNGQRVIEGRLCRIEANLEQTATKADLYDLRAEMYKAIGEIKTWMVATLITIVGTVLAASFGLHHWSG